MTLNHALTDNITILCVHAAVTIVVYFAFSSKPTAEC